MEIAEKRRSPFKLGRNHLGKGLADLYLAKPPVLRGGPRTRPHQG